jgi:hypothetical protein
LLSDRVLSDSAHYIAEGLLQVLDIFLIGRGDLVDLVWRVSVLQAMTTVLGQRTLGHVRHLVLAHGPESLPFELALGLRIDAEEVQVSTGQCQDAGKDSEDRSNAHGDDRQRLMYAR